jgi:hypothetical protein
MRLQHDVSLITRGHADEISPQRPIPSLANCDAIGSKPFPFRNEKRNLNQTHHGCQRALSRLMLHAAPAMPWAPL